jgi:hypothetical protein
MQKKPLTVMVIRKYSPFPINAMRNMIDGIGKRDSQFFSHDKGTSESKNARHSLFFNFRFDPDAFQLTPSIISFGIRAHIGDFCAFWGEHTTVRGWCGFIIRALC